MATEHGGRVMLRWPFSPEMAAALRAKLAERTETVPESGCWLWSGGVTDKGYGAVYPPGAYALPAHRAAWMIYRGEIPAGLFVCHKCDTRRCINPDHLFLGTPLDNMRDMIAKGRDDFPAGERHSHARLTSQQVIEIRTCGLPQIEIAKRFGISTATVAQIINRKSWTHLPVAPGEKKAPALRLCGEALPGSKLTNEKAMAVYLDPRGARQIASDYGVSEALVRMVKKGRIWRHVTGAAA